jgi:hypothetical protein
MVIVRNPTEAPIHVSHGERIAQMVLARYEVLEVVTGSVSVTTTRIGGFGSTGGWPPKTVRAAVDDHGGPSVFGHRNRQASGALSSVKLSGFRRSCRYEFR